MLRTIIIYFLFAVAGIVFQSNITTQTLTFQTVPDLLLILTVVSALKMQKTQAIVASFLIGLISDFSTGFIAGPQAAGHLLACIFTQSFSKNVYSHRLLSLAVVMSGAVIVKEIVSNLLINFFAPRDILLDRVSIMLSTLPFEVLLTALIAPFFIRLLSRNVSNNG